MVVRLVADHRIQAAHRGAGQMLARLEAAPPGAVLRVEAVLRVGVVVLRVGVDLAAVRRAGAVHLHQAVVHLRLAGAVHLRLAGAVHLRLAGAVHLRLAAGRQSGHWARPRLALPRSRGRTCSGPDYPYHSACTLALAVLPYSH